MIDKDILKEAQDMCSDNRFILIEKYKNMLIVDTNIETSEDEMAVIDSILFRFWKMGWLDKLEQFDKLKAENAIFSFQLSSASFSKDLFKDFTASYLKILEEHPSLSFYKEIIDSQSAEIERLKEKYNRTMDNLKMVLSERADHSEAINEFAEKVDYLIGITPSVPNRAYCKLSADIKKLLKEMVGDDNA